MLVHVDHLGDAGTHPHGDGFQAPGQLAAHQIRPRRKFAETGFIGEILDQRRPSSQEPNEDLGCHGRHVVFESVSIRVQGFLARTPRPFLEGEGGQSGVNHTLDVDAGSLNNGMYQIRLSSSAYLVVKKLLVSE